MRCDASDALRIRRSAAQRAGPASQRHPASSLRIQPDQLHAHRSDSQPVVSAQVSARTYTHARTHTRAVRMAESDDATRPRRRGNSGSGGGDHGGGGCLCLSFVLLFFLFVTPARADPRGSNCIEGGGEREESGFTHMMHPWIDGVHGCDRPTRRRSAATRRSLLRLCLPPPPAHRFASTRRQRCASLAIIQLSHSHCRSERNTTCTGAKPVGPGQQSLRFEWAS